MHCPRDPRLAIIVLNYRQPELVVQCLQSLTEQLLPADQVVVVDNASGDGSDQAIAQAIQTHGWSAWAQLVRSPTNDGFSAGNNHGMQSGQADAYLLLNSDTIVRPGALSALRQALTSNPRAGLIGPRLEWPDGRAQISCFNDPHPLSELINAACTGPITRALKRWDIPGQVSDEPAAIEWLSFAAVVIRREVLEQIGLMDEGYFMYFEDADYARRARNAGWQVLHWPAARVVHLRGGSSNVKAMSEQRKRRPAYYYAARSRYYAKFYGRVGLWLANVLWHAGRAVAVMRETVQRKPKSACEREWLDNWTGALNPLKKYRPPTQGETS